MYFILISILNIISNINIIIDNYIYSCVINKISCKGNDSPIHVLCQSHNPLILDEMDKWTGYSYYSIGQMLTLNSIRHINPII